MQIVQTNITPFGPEEKGDCYPPCSVWSVFGNTIVNSYKARVETCPIRTTAALWARYHFLVESLSVSCCVAGEQVAAGCLDIPSISRQKRSREKTRPIMIILVDIKLSSWQPDNPTWSLHILLIGQWQRGPSTGSWLVTGRPGGTDCLSKNKNQLSWCVAFLGRGPATACQPDPLTDWRETQHSTEQL